MFMLYTFPTLGTYPPASLSERASPYVIDRINRIMTRSEQGQKTSGSKQEVTSDEDGK